MTVGSSGKYSTPIVNANALSFFLAGQLWGMYSPLYGWRFYWSQSYFL